MSHYIGDPTITGSTASGGSTAIDSTSHATKGNVTIHTNGVFNSTGQLSLTAAAGEALSIRSGAAGSYVTVGIGRTTSEVLAVVPGDTGQFSNAARAGDFVLRNSDSSKYIILQSGTGDATAILTDAHNVKIGNAGGLVLRGTTEGTNHLDIFNGTAPAGTLTNGVSIYSSAGEAYIMDAGGTATQQTPHNKNGEWHFNSINTKTGKRLVIDVERMLRFLNDKFGTDFIKEYIE